MSLLVESGPAIKGLLSYREAEYSFQFEVASTDIFAADREGDAGRASIAVGTLQIEVGASTGIALFVWGLHPRNRWREGRLPGPLARAGIVRFDGEFEASISRLLVSVGEWSTIYDRDSGWLRMAGDCHDPDEVLVEIASGVVLGARKGGLNSVWLNPVMV